MRRLEILVFEKIAYVLNEWSHMALSWYGPHKNLDNSIFQTKFEWGSYFFIGSMKKYLHFDLLTRLQYLSYNTLQR